MDTPTPVVVLTENVPAIGATAVEESTRPVRTTNNRKRARDWWDRVFSEGFTPEDIILYLITIVLTILFWRLFNNLHQDEFEMIDGFSAEVSKAWTPVTSTEAASWQNGSLSLDYIRAQVTITAMRYQQASISTAALSTRLNLGFLVGTIITILGCITVIRGVRGSNTLKVDVPGVGEVVSGGSVDLTTSFPGIVVVVVGGLILVSALLGAGQRAEVKDNGILMPPYFASQVTVTQTPAGFIPTGIAATTTPAPTTTPVSTTTP